MDLSINAPVMNETITGTDVTLRRWLTPLAVVLVLALATTSMLRAARGEGIGPEGTLLVLALVATMGVKFAAEAYQMSYLGAEQSPREQAASKMLARHAGLMKLRYTLGALGGIVLPLGVQALTAGLKDIPSISDPMTPAVVACFAAAMLLPGEFAERRLWRLSTHEQ